MLYRICTFTNNLIFTFYWQLFYGRFGFRALCSPNEFQNEYTVKIINGNPKVVLTGSYIPTVISAFKDILKDIKRDREEFEAAPDTGFFGKSTARICNLFYNYIILFLIIGVFFILIGFTLLLLLTSTIFLFLLFFSLAFGPAISPLFYLFQFFIFDFDQESIPTWRTNYRVAPLLSEMILNLFYFGVIQIMMALMWLVLHPILAALWFCYAVVKYCFLNIKDLGMWIFIKCCGRVPDYDTCIAWKVQSPQIFDTVDASEFTYIGLEEIYILVVAELEKIQLIKYNELAEKKLKQFMNNAYNTADLIFDIYKLGNNKFPSQIKEDYNAISKILSQQIEKRKLLYPTPPNRVRLTQEELNLTIDSTMTIVKDFLRDNKMEFIWAYFSIEQDNYQELAERLLKRIFTNSIMEPLEELAKRVKITTDKSSEFSKIVKYIEGDHQALKARFVNYQLPSKNKTMIEKIPAPNFLSFRELIVSITSSSILRFNQNFDNWESVLLFPVQTYKNIKANSEQSIKIINL